MAVRTILFLLFLLPISIYADELVGRTVHVSDGDSFIVLANGTEFRVRIQGIDAPERRQPYSRKARESLAEQIADKEITVQYDKKDRYGRIVGKVLVNDNDVGLVQLQRGLAWFYRYYQQELSPEDKAAYAQAEDDARQKKLGLWSDNQPMPPWEFRRMR
jgi:endonuclease YncB( thermonuclease family)